MVINCFFLQQKRDRHFIFQWDQSAVILLEKAKRGNLDKNGTIHFIGQIHD